MLRIFIGYDSREDEACRILEYSLRKHSSIALDIHFLKKDELGFYRPRDLLQSTEFTYTRFLIPHLCRFEGRAVFMDGDMLCLSDVKELALMDMKRFALRVVKHDYHPVEKRKMDGCHQTVYRRKNWSSLMVMDCQKLSLWSKPLVETKPGLFLHTFEGVKDEWIGEMPHFWNSLDRLDEKTKMIHYTRGGPWFDQYREHPHGEIWFRYRKEWLSKL